MKLQWIKFVGGTLDGETRPIILPVADGDTYNRMVPFDETWAFSTEHDAFVLQVPA